MLEDNRDDIVAILAGYPHEMTQLVAVNPGLASRFPTTIAFHDYSAEELMAIADKMLAEEQLLLAPEARARLLVAFGIVASVSARAVPRPLLLRLMESRVHDPCAPTVFPEPVGCCSHCPRCPECAFRGRLRVSLSPDRMSLTLLSSAVLAPSTSAFLCAPRHPVRLVRRATTRPAATRAPCATCSRWLRGSKRCAW
jgi:hypothetical protein